MKKFALHGIALTFSTLTCTLALAADQVGTLTQLEGSVKLFANPSKTPRPEGKAGNGIVQVRPRHSR